MNAETSTLAMLRVVQIPPMQPLEMSPEKQVFLPQAPKATCVLLPVQNSDVTQTSTIQLQTLSNNNNNDISNKNIEKKETTRYAKIQPVTPGMARTKRKTTKSLPASARKASSVARRNERERNRVKQVNQGFERLRQHVPNGSKNKKMSKVDTLRSALEYIKYMQELLEATDPNKESDGVETPLPTFQPPTQTDMECENSSPNHSSFEDDVPSPEVFTSDVTQQLSSEQPPIMTSQQDEFLDLSSFWFMPS